MTPMLRVREPSLPHPVCRSPCVMIVSGRGRGAVAERGARAGQLRAILAREGITSSAAERRGHQHSKQTAFVFMGVNLFDCGLSLGLRGSGWVLRDYWVLSVLRVFDSEAKVPGAGRPGCRRRALGAGAGGGNVLVTAHIISSQRPALLSLFPFSNPTELSELNHTSSHTTPTAHYHHTTHNVSFQPLPPSPPRTLVLIRRRTRHSQRGDRVTQPPARAPLADCLLPLS